MADAFEPMPPPPDQLEDTTVKPWATPVHISSIITALAGATVMATYYLTLMSLDGPNGWTQSYPTSTAPDSTLLVILGLLLLAMGVGRFFTNHLVFRSGTLAVGVLVIMLCDGDADILLERFNRLFGDPAPVTFTYGPALFTAGAAAVAAMVSSVLPMKIGRGGTRTGMVIGCAVLILVIAMGVEHAISIGPVT